MCRPLAHRWPCDVAPYTAERILRRERGKPAGPSQRRAASDPAACTLNHALQASLCLALPGDRKHHRTSWKHTVMAQGRLRLLCRQAGEDHEVDLQGSLQRSFWVTGGEAASSLVRLCQLGHTECTLLRPAPPLRGRGALAARASRTAFSAW